MAKLSFLFNWAAVIQGIENEIKTKKIIIIIEVFKN